MQKVLAVFVLPLALTATFALLQNRVVSPAYAQQPSSSPLLDQTIDAFSVAQYFPISEPANNIKTGMVISHRNGRYTYSAEHYDKNMFGVLSLEPAVSFSTDQPPEGSYPVVTTGTALVMVNASNGPIVKGDLLTSSDQPGIAMKANQSGFTLGVAAQAYNPSDPMEVAAIPVSLEIKFTFSEDSPNSQKISTRLKDLVSLSAIAAVESPTQALQYVVASLCLIGSLTFAILSFIKAAQKGIDALGRNPLAKASISMGITINAIISVIIALAGLAGAYFMLTM